MRATMTMMEVNGDKEDALCLNTNAGFRRNLIRYDLATKYKVSKGA